MSKELKIGQEIYVNQSSLMLRNPDNIEKYEITKINTVSVYAKPTNRDFVVRFKKSNLTAKDGFGTYYKAYLTEDEYWDKVKIKKETIEMKNKINKVVEELSHKELKELLSSPVMKAHLLNCK